VSRDKAAAVGDRGGVGVEEADESIDVLGFPCLLEVFDDFGLLGCRNRGRLRVANSTAGRGGQLATGRGSTADDLGYFGERVASSWLPSRALLVRVGASIAWGPVR
jgi:hypothetical protein